METPLSQSTSQTRHDPSGPDRHLKILVIDDHCLVRDGLRLSLKQLDRNAVIIEADGVRQAIDACLQHPDLDLVLMDLGLPGHTGLQALEALYSSCPDARVVIVSATHDFRTVRAALARGVSGFIPKMSGASAMINALRFILNGDIYVPPEVFLDFEPEPPVKPLPPKVTIAKRSTPRYKLSPREAGLTTRQIDVLRLLVEGKTNKQICSELELAMGTVKSHITSILQTLESSTRSLAVAKVDDRGWRDIVMREGRPGKTHQKS